MKYYYNTCTSCVYSVFTSVYTVKPALINWQLAHNKPAQVATPKLRGEIAKCGMYEQALENAMTTLQTSQKASSVHLNSLYNVQWQ